MATTSGPFKGNVYQGRTIPAENQWAGNRLKPDNAKPVTETVFNEATFVPKKTDNSVAVKATRNKARRMSLRFFFVAAISLVEAVAFLQRDLIAVGFSAGVVAALFALLGVFAFSMKKGAFLTGAVIYGLNTAFLVVAFLLSSNIMLIYAIVVHCLIVWRLWCMYDLIRELETD